MSSSGFPAVTVVNAGTTVGLGVIGVVTELAVVAEVGYVTTVAVVVLLVRDDPGWGMTWVNQPVPNSNAKIAMPTLTFGHGSPFSRPDIGLDSSRNRPRTPYR